MATLNIKFPPAPRSGQIVAEINEAGMSFGAKHVFSGANFIIGKGDKIALVGRNGEGKTTLARMLVGQLTPTEGSVRLGANVNIGYYAQNQDDLMDGEFTVYDTLDRVAVGTSVPACAISSGRSCSAARISTKGQRCFRAASGHVWPWPA